MESASGGQRSTQSAQRMQRSSSSNSAVAGAPVWSGATSRTGTREMTFTGHVPSAGKAGEQVRELLKELKSLGVLPFYRKAA